MMKISNLIAACILLLFVGCVDDNDFVTPDIGPDVPNSCQAVNISDYSGDFFDNFESYPLGDPPSGNWISVEELGNRNFEVTNFDGNNAYIQMSAYGTSNVTDTWLISPRLDLSTMSDPIFSMKVADAFQNGNPLEVLVSTDYDGSACPSTFSWTAIGQTQIASLINNSAVYDNIFESTGNISLAAFSTAIITLAIRYNSNTSITTTVQIDDVRVGTAAAQSNPTAVNVSVSGSFNIGQILTGNYTYQDADSDPEGTSSYRWYMADDATGSNEQEITGQTSKNYTIALAEGKFIAFEVTPTQTDRTTGVAVKSSYNQIVAVSSVVLAFDGGDMETDMMLSSFGMKSYASYVDNAGRDNSRALHINGVPIANDYVFTAIHANQSASGFTKLSFYLKGSVDTRSLSINVYKPDGTYVKYNLGIVTGDTFLNASGSNNYSGSIDTAGQWVKISLNLQTVGMEITQVPTLTDNWVSVKVGKDANYDLYLDDFTLE